MLSPGIQQADPFSGDRKSSSKGGQRKQTNSFCCLLYGLREIKRNPFENNAIARPIQLPTMASYKRNNLRLGPLLGDQLHLQIDGGNYARS
jgi:hypothetical protein